MKRHILLIIVLLTALIVRSQNQANNWYFGENAGITFSGGAPVAVTGGQINTLEGCSAISSSDGDLLFYSDGSTVWDKNHTMMPNGFGLMGNYSSTQSAIIVPIPNNDSLYYLFTVDAEENNLQNGLRYSQVDMTLNNGLGDVVQSNKNTLLVTPVLEKVTAVGHGTLNATWVITHTFNSSLFYAYLVREIGISPPVISDVGDNIGPLMVDSKGYLKVSPDGTKLVMANNTLQTLLIFDFDNTTGLVSNQIRDDRFVITPFPYGIGFSPNSKLLYATNWSWAGWDTRIYQYDISLPTPDEILNSRNEIASFTDLYGELQLGPDKKLYVAQNESYYLGVINKPDIYGPNCDYVHDAIYLGKRSRWGLPPFIQSFFNLNAYFYNDTSCYGVATQFYEDCSHPPDSVFWDFGDIPSGVNNYSTLFNPTHTFSSVGLYNVSLTAYFDGYTDSTSSLVFVSEMPAVNLGNDTSLCMGSNITLDAGPGHTGYLWQNGNTTQSITTDTSGIFWVEVANDFGCKSIDSITVSVNPVSTNYIDTTICQGQTVYAGGALQGAAGTYYDSLATAFNCDSIIITNLIVSDTFGFIIPVSICTGDSVFAGGSWQFQSGIFYDYGITTQGCDSTIITELTVDAVIQNNFEITICQGDSAYICGAYQTAAGIYYDSAISVFGCDSIAICELFLAEKYNMAVDTTICEGDSIFLNNAYRNQSGIYIGNATSIDGCDSIISTTLDIEMLPSVFLGNDTVIENGSELLLDAYYPNATYLWQDGSGNASFTVSEEGLYSVIVTGNCGFDTDSIYIDIDMGSISCGVYVPNAFSPNGDLKNDVFIPVFDCNFTNYKLNIFDRWGQMVFSTADQSEGWDGIINDEVVPVGVYAWTLSYTVMPDINSGAQTKSGTVLVIY
ncbi:MAG: gliding motility-associated C-terminal domain-containing protein [Bacteroidota bacterium]